MLARAEHEVVADFLPVLDDKPCSYGGATRAVLPEVDRRADKGLSNRMEISHRQTRQGERSWAGSNLADRPKGFSSTMTESYAGSLPAATFLPPDHAVALALPL